MVGDCFSCVWTACRVWAVHFYTNQPFYVALFGRRIWIGVVICMRYFIRDIAKCCVIEYGKFLIENSIFVSEYSGSDLYELYCYSLKNILNLEVSEYNKLIDVYGASCVEHLGNKVPVLNKTAKGKLNSRCDLYTYCNLMYVFTDVVYKSCELEEVCNED